jgi:hypothetical protein
MGVLKFDDTNDYVRFGTVDASLAAVSTTAWTVAVLLKRAGTGANWDAISYAISTTTIRAGMSFEGSSTDQVYMDYGSNRNTGATKFTNTTSPYLLVLSKAAGASTPRLGWKLGSGGAWTHTAMSGTQADTGSCTLIDIGSWKTSTDYFNGWIGVVAWWSGAMSDANKEALDDNWRTSDLHSSAHGTPLFLCELNVAGGSLVDLEAHASGLSVPNAPTLDSGETLDSWNFNGTGAGGGATEDPFPYINGGYYG